MDFWDLCRGASFLVSAIEAVFLQEDVPLMGRPYSSEQRLGVSHCIHGSVNTLFSGSNITMGPDL